MYIFTHCMAQNAATQLCYKFANSTFGCQKTYIYICIYLITLFQGRLLCIPYKSIFMDHSIQTKILNLHIMNYLLDDILWFGIHHSNFTSHVHVVVAGDVETGRS